MTLSNLIVLEDDQPIEEFDGMEGKVEKGGWAWVNMPVPALNVLQYEPFLDPGMYEERDWGVSGLSSVGHFIDSKS